MQEPFLRIRDITNQARCDLVNGNQGKQKTRAGVGERWRKVADRLGDRFPVF